MFMAIGGGVITDYFDYEIISKIHKAFYIHACVLRDCTYLTKKEHMEDLDKTGEVIYKIFNEIRDLSEDERNDAWGFVASYDIYRYSRQQQVCSEHYFDFNTGLCKDADLKDKNRHKCSKYPLCQRKVSDPIIRSEKV